MIQLNNVTFSLVLTLLAGLSTMIGSLLIFTNKKKDKILVSSLSFATGVMVTVSLTDLIPESINLLIENSKNKIFFLIFIYFIIGTLVAYLVNKLTMKLEENKLYKIGIISMIAIIIHNIPEGMATFIAGNQNTKLGITLAIAIGLHNIPEGISIAIPIYYATGNKLKALFYTFISGISEFLGAILTYLFLRPYISNNLLGCLFSFIAGIMVYISLLELLPTAIDYNNKKRVVVYITIGVILMLINNLLN